MCGCVEYFNSKIEFGHGADNPISQIGLLRKVDLLAAHAHDGTGAGAIVAVADKERAEMAFGFY